MWLANTLAYNANEICFSAAMIISFLFYKQYKKYEEEADREELIEQFLNR